MILIRMGMLVPVAGLVVAALVGPASAKPVNSKGNKPSIGATVEAPVEAVLEAIDEALEPVYNPPESGDSFASKLDVALAWLGLDLPAKDAERVRSGLEDVVEIAITSASPQMLVFLDVESSAKKVSLATMATVRHTETASVDWQSEVWFSVNASKATVSDGAKLISAVKAFDAGDFGKLLESDWHEWFLRFDCRYSWWSTNVVAVFVVFVDSTGDLVIEVSDFAHASQECTGSLLNVPLAKPLAAQGGD